MVRQGRYTNYEFILTFHRESSEKLPRSARTLPFPQPASCSSPGLQMRSAPVCYIAPSDAPLNREAAAAAAAGAAGGDAASQRALPEAPLVSPLGCSRRKPEPPSSPHPRRRSRCRKPQHQLPAALAAAVALVGHGGCFWRGFWPGKPQPPPPPLVGHRGGLWRGLRCRCDRRLHWQGMCTCCCRMLLCAVVAKLQRCTSALSPRNWVWRHHWNLWIGSRH